MTKRKPWCWIRVKIQAEPREVWHLEDARGRNRATVWDNGTWHSWDTEGVGGENDVCKTVGDAMDQSLAAVVRQGWTPFKVVYEKAAKVVSSGSGRAK